jgi:serine 3-dehydrogenase (NADP+)
MKTVIVTGVSQGLGHHIADAFAAAGWRVVGTGRSERPASLPDTVEYVQFDASDAAACRDFWHSLQFESDEVCLVNNAGGYVIGGLAETKDEDYEKQMASNYFAGVHMTRGLIDATEKARIFTIISHIALATYARSGAYGASKVAAKYFFEALQKEYANSEYRITNVYPSDIATHGPNEAAIDPDDLAAFIVELAQSQASYYLPNVTMYPTKSASS